MEMFEMFLPEQQFLRNLKSCFRDSNSRWPRVLSIIVDPKKIGVAPILSEGNLGDERR